MDYSQFFRENYDVLLTIMNGFDIGIWITDGAGNVIMVNDRSLKGGKVSREELMGRNMVELVETGYVIHESSVLKAIDSGKQESIIQELGEGGYCLATSTPLFYKGKTNIVLCMQNRQHGSCAFAASLLLACGWTCRNRLLDGGIYRVISLAIDCSVIILKKCTRECVKRNDAEPVQVKSSAVASVRIV